MSIESQIAENFIAFADTLRAQHMPLTFTEDILVARMAQSLWMATRIVTLPSSSFPQTPDRRLSLYLFYQSRYDWALTTLQSFRKEARRAEAAAKAQTRARQVHEAKILKLKARSEALERAAQVRKTRASLLAAYRPLWLS